MFQDLFEYFKVYNCFFWWFGAIPKCSWCSWGCSHLAAWLSPQTSMGWAFFQGELIGRCAGRSGLPGKCEGDHSTGAGLHLHPAHPSQGPFGGSKMADIYCGPRPEIIRGLVRKSANWQIPLLISLSNSFFHSHNLGKSRKSIMAQDAPRRRRFAARCQEIFLDFDPLRCGRCTPHQFVRGLNSVAGSSEVLVYDSICRYGGRHSKCNIYIYMYIYIYVYIHIYICIYIYMIIHVYDTCHDQKFDYCIYHSGAWPSIHS